MFDQSCWAVGVIVISVCLVLGVIGLIGLGIHFCICAKNDFIGWNENRKARKEDEINLMYH